MVGGFTKVIHMVYLGFNFILQNMFKNYLLKERELMELMIVEFEKIQSRLEKAYIEMIPQSLLASLKKDLGSSFSVVLDDLQESISNDRGLKNLREKSQEIVGEFSRKTGIQLKVIKLPRWHLDALVLKIDSDKLTSSVILKAYPEAFPIAATILENHQLLRALSDSGVSIEVIGTNSIKQMKNSLYPLRWIFYRYVEGENAEKFVRKFPERRGEVAIAITECAHILSSRLGLLPSMRRLDDFMVKEENGKLKAFLTDSNTIAYCPTIEKGFCSATVPFFASQANLMTNEVLKVKES